MKPGYQPGMMLPSSPQSLGAQLLTIAILAIPVACIAWTVTHEEVFREPREWCKHKSETCRHIIERKFFYLFTCEYCFSHYVSLLVLAISGFRLLLPDWRGFLFAWFALVWIANVYMSLFGRLRLTIKHEGKEIAAVEKELEEHLPPRRERRLRSR